MEQQQFEQNNNSMSILNLENNVQLKKANKSKI